MLHRILIAVENELYRKSICAMLRSVEGWQICGEAITGMEAIEKAQRCRPDLVILDSRLTSVSALEAARHIRAGRASVELVIFSGRRTSKQYVTRALRAGARGCISRDELSSLLVSAIQSVRRGDVYLSPAVLASSGQARAAEAAPIEGRPSDAKHLTPREVEVLQLISNGSKNREAAEALHVSIKTIESHRMSIRRKLGIESVVDLVRYAIRQNLAHP
jgi:DNA-binding NarL/FixJ family response regulator